MPTVTCSTEIICPGEKVTLTVNNCSGTPNWSTGETANMIIVTPAVTTAYTVYCQNSGGCRSDESARYTITVTPALPPAITASATAVAPGGTVSLTAMGCAGEVIWNANDINGNNKGSVMVVRPEGAQSYYARCRFRECLSDPSRTILVNGSANAGDCSTLAGTLKPVSATVAATTGQSVVIAATPDKASVQPPDYTTVYVLTKGTGLVVQQTGPRPSFTVPATAAQYAIHTLIYNGNPTSPNYFDITDVKLGISTVANIVSLIDSRRVCADIDVAGARITVGRTPVVEPPVAEPPVAGPPVVSVSSQTVCAGTTVTFTANGCVGGVINWSDGSTGLSITKTVNADLQLTVTCTRNGVVSAASPSATVTVTPKPEQPQAIDRTNACPSTTVNVATGVTSRLSTSGGVFEYYTNATLSADSKVANPAAAGAGTYYAVEKSANGCYSLPALIRVAITPCGVAAACDGVNPATANAGADAGICAAKTYQLSGQMGGGGKTARWTTNGSGTFDNPSATNAIYTASAQDVLAGKVSLTLSVSTANAACPVAKDDMVLTVVGSNVSPVITVVGTTNVCSGDSVTLQAPAGAVYLWTNRATTQRIVVKTGGTYSVQMIDASGCSSLKSADVTVNVTNCTPVDTATTDVSITKTVSKPTVAVGDVITYTLNVRNLSTRRATNVDVRDVLPTGLEWVPVSETGYTISGKTITQRIDTLRANQSVSIVFAARVTVAGDITNQAVITYLDQRDTNTGNNQSQVTVTPGSTPPTPVPPVPGPAGKPGLIGLAKMVAGTPVVLGDSLVRVSYNFVLTNYGTDTLRNVRVTEPTRLTGKYTLEFLNLNTRRPEFSPMLYKDGLVFVSAGSKRVGDPLGGRRTPFLDLFYLPKGDALLSANASERRAARQQSASMLGRDEYTASTANDSRTVGRSVGMNMSERPVNESERFSRTISSKYHEGPATFSKDGSRVIFTRNSYTDGKYRDSRDGVNKLKLYTATQTNGYWSKADQLPFNSDNFSTGHPSLANGRNGEPDQLLYFSSDRPGGFGGTDIYVSTWTNGAWGTPVNLGKSVNSERNELFPFVDERGNLYVASNGHGGLDIFYVPLTGAGQPAGVLTNLGEPLNSTHDDFGIVTDGQRSRGYFSSNRKRGKADDDLYRFARNASASDCRELTVSVFDADTQEPLVNTSIAVDNPANEQPDRFRTDASGSVRICMTADSDTRLVASRDGYAANRVGFSVGQSVDTQASHLNIGLTKSATESKPDATMLRGRVLTQATRKPIAGVVVTVVNECDGIT